MMDASDEVFLPEHSLEKVKAVEQNGIGYVGNVPCVASWFVPYDLPEKVRFQGRENIPCDVGPMRGSNQGIHSRAPASSGWGKCVYEGKYYMARRLGQRIAKTMKKKKTYVISFRINKHHWMPSPVLDGPRTVGQRWDRDFRGGFLGEMLGDDEYIIPIDKLDGISIITDYVQDRAVVIGYVERKQNGEFGVVRELMSEYCKSLMAEKEMA